MEIPCNIKAGISMLAQLSAKWFQRVTYRLNHLIGTNSIRTTVRDDDSIEIGVDYEDLTNSLRGLGFMQTGAETGRINGRNMGGVAVDVAGQVLVDDGTNKDLRAVEDLSAIMVDVIAEDGTSQTQASAACSKWFSGRGRGIDLDVYIKCDYAGSSFTSFHYLQKATLHISEGGLIEGITTSSERYRIRA